MSERNITIRGADAREVLGVNDQHLRTIRDHFPKLMLVARGNEIKAIGDPEELDRFELAFGRVVAHVGRYREITKDVIHSILRDQEVGAISVPKDDPAILVHGNEGLRIKARTKNQQRLVESVRDHDMVFAVGPAGTGKTYTAVALAVKAWKDREVRRIILTRPAVEAGENLGFLPGDLKEKLDPYLQPLYDALHDMIPGDRLSELMNNGVIQIAPLAFMRGRTLDHAFVILDEAQNATIPQLKMFLTRMGRSAKFTITGDVTQVDLPSHQRSGLVPAIECLKAVDGIAVVELDETDIIRHALVGKIIRAFDQINDKDIERK